jgi:hypothetical protein
VEEAVAIGTWRIKKVNPDFRKVKHQDVRLPFTYYPTAFLFTVRAPLSL